MSIYESNKLSNLSINSDDSIKEDASVAMSDSNADSNLSEDIQESNINLDDYINENSTGVMKFTSSIIESNFDLFGRLLKADFASECEKQTLNESTSDENNKQNVIRHETNKLFEDAISSIANESKNLISKIESFYESDKKTFDKYLPYMKTELLENFKAIGKISFPDEVKSTVTDSILDLSGLSDIFNEAIDEINKHEGDSYSDIVENYFMRIEKDNEEVNNKVDSIVEVEDWAPTEEAINLINLFSDSKVLVNNIKESTKEFIDGIKKLNEDSYRDDTALNVYSNKINEDSNAKNFAIYLLSSNIIKEALNRANIYNDLMIREVANIRKAMILCGRKAIEEAKNSDIDSSVLKSISESSDFYVYSKFNQEVM